MTDQTNVTEDAIEEIYAIASAMRELAQMIECENIVKDAQCLATGLVAMAEKVMQKSHVALRQLDNAAPHVEAA